VSSPSAGRPRALGPPAPRTRACGPQLNFTPRDELVAGAVEKLGETPSLSEDARVKLNDLIAGTDLTTFYGPIQFASEGDHFHNNTALDPMLVQIQGGQVKAIAPPESAEAQIIYPLAPLG
jgi:branched-chain amino acid transport system substrate-binding protein